MKPERVVGAGLLTGGLFYLAAMFLGSLLKMVPVIPLALAIPTQDFTGAVQFYLPVVALLTGLFWAAGYAVYGKGKSGWLYGLVAFAIGFLPAFIALLLLTPSPVGVVLYGALLSLLGALLGGKLLALIIK